MRLLALVSVALVAAAAACGGSSGERPLTVFAAASLTDVFQQLEPGATFNFAGSDELATQIREGARFDAYAAASPRYPGELVDEGLVDELRVFATNRLVIAVPVDNPAGITSLDDLRASGIKLVVAAEGVPAGDYTREALEELGAADVLANAVSQEEDVRGVLGKVALGEADAGFVYATDARVAEDDVAVVELPEGGQPPIEYVVALSVETDRREEAAAFVERLVGDEGRRELRDAGFGVP